MTFPKVIRERLMLAPSWRENKWTSRQRSMEECNNMFSVICPRIVRPRHEIIWIKWWEINNINIITTFNKASSINNVSYRNQIILGYIEIICKKNLFTLKPETFAAQNLKLLTSVARNFVSSKDLRMSRVVTKSFHDIKVSQIRISWKIQETSGFTVKFFLITTKSPIGKRKQAENKTL